MFENLQCSVAFETPLATLHAFQGAHNQFAFQGVHIAVLPFKVRTPNSFFKVSTFKVPPVRAALIEMRRRARLDVQVSVHGRSSRMPSGKFFYHACSLHDNNTHVTVHMYGPLVQGLVFESTTAFAKHEFPFSRHAN